MTCPKPIQITIFKQRCHDRIQFRVMRPDGGLVFDGKHHMDFSCHDDCYDVPRMKHVAEACIKSWLRRTKQVGIVTHKDNS